MRRTLIKDCTCHRNPENGVSAAILTASASGLIAAIGTFKI
jgi:hypothetical protein